MPNNGKRTRLKCLKRNKNKNWKKASKADKTKVLLLPDTRSNQAPVIVETKIKMTEKRLNIPMVQKSCFIFQKNIFINKLENEMITEKIKWMKNKTPIGFNQTPP